MKKISIVIIQIGILICSGAVFWWHAFYRIIAQQLVVSLGEEDPTLASGFQCLYSTAGHCGAIIEYGEGIGKTVYSPLYFWLGLALIAIGGLLRLFDRSHL